MPKKAGSKNKMTVGRFHVRPVLTVCVLLALAILGSLGTWQLQRLQWKRALIAQVEARANAAPIPFEEARARADAGENLEYAPVSLTGVFVSDNEARVFGSYEATPGAYFFSPFKTSLGVIYVNRGFAPQDVDVPPPEGKGANKTVTGYFRYAEQPTPPASWFRPSEQSVGGLWFVRDPQKFAGAAGLATSRYYIDQFEVAGQAWPKGGTTRIEFNNRHLEYALTWFGLGAALIGVWVIFSLQSPTNTNNFKK